MNNKTRTLFLVLLILGKFTFAQADKTDSLLGLLAKHTEVDTAKINLLNQIAGELKFTDISKTLLYATQADSLSDILGFKKGKTKSLQHIGNYHFYTQNISKALAYYQQALNVSKEIDDKRGISYIYNYIGNVYLMQGDYPKAVEYYEKALRAFIEIDDKIGISGCYNNFANIYYMQGDYPRTLEYFQKALKVFEELTNKTGIAGTFNNMGVVSDEQGNYAKALEYYQKALKMRKELNDRYGTSDTYTNIGNVYYAEKDYSKALEYFQKSHEINEELGNKSGLAISYLNIGVVFRIRKDYSKSLNYFQKSMSIARKISSQDIITTNNIEFSNAYFSLKNYKLAIRYGSIAFQAAVESGERDNIKKAADVLAKSYAAMRDFEKAYKFHREFKAQNDSLFNESNIEKITNLENQYKFEKEKESIAAEQAKKDALKEAELKRQKTVRNSFIIGFVLMIVFVLIIFRNLTKIRKANRLLASQKEEIVSQKEEIQEQARELEIKNKNLFELSKFKKLMTDTVIHDLKNPLNHIIGSTKEKTIRQSGYTMLNIVMNILDINKAQSTKLNIQPENQSVATLIDEAIEQVEFLAEQKNLIFEKLLPKEFIIKADRDLTIRTLVNLFTNAIKYSPLNSRLTIQAIENGDKLQIDVIDYGKGISNENIKTIFDEYTQIDAKKSGKVQSTGIGLTFCKIATEAQNAHIEVCSVPGEKTQFSLIYPLVSVLEKETAIEEETQKVSLLTLEERKMLRDIFLALRKLETYQASEILKRLQTIENPSENINNWMQKIKNAMFSSNNELYNKLIDNEL
jgi:signal transduction histidine kinase